MSGGSYDYADGKIRSIISDIDEHIRSSKDYQREMKYGESTYTGIEKEVKDVKKILNDVSELIHELEWYTSGDTGKDDFLNAYNKFKLKLSKGGSNGRTKKSRRDSKTGN